LVATVLWISAKFGLAGLISGGTKLTLKPDLLRGEGEVEHVGDLEVGCWSP
jgi:hypothetical protein